jgi:hypothetical protein
MLAVYHAGPEAGTRTHANVRPNSAKAPDRIGVASVEDPFADI